MKKIMVIVALVLAAGLSQAASLVWNSGGFAQGFANPFGASFGSSTAYTLFLYIWNDAAGTIPFDDAGTGTQVMDDTASFGAYSGTTANVFPQATALTQYGQMMIREDVGPAVWWQRTSTIRRLGTTPTTGNLNINFGTGLGFLGGTAGGSLWTGTNWEQIPEPTSLALLGVGAAAIGLRRKLRKKA